MKLPNRFEFGTFFVANFYLECFFDTHYQFDDSKSHQLLF